MLADAAGWLGATVLEARTVGWSTVLTARIDHLDIAAGDADLLGHLRGRYLPISS